MDFCAFEISWYTVIGEVMIELRSILLACASDIGVNT